MPRKIVDFSAISKIIRDEPFYLHFWESTPQEALEFLKNPRAELEKMGIKLPANCRIETTIENHDYLSAHTGGLALKLTERLFVAPAAGMLARTTTKSRSTPTIKPRWANSLRKR